MKMTQFTARKQVIYLALKFWHDIKCWF